MSEVTIRKLDVYLKGIDSLKHTFGIETLIKRTCQDVSESVVATLERRGFLVVDVPRLTQHFMSQVDIGEKCKVIFPLKFIHKIGIRDK